jgi:bZIP transcription factor.
MVERPPGLALTGANLLSQKLDMMDKLLKAVAASASQAQVVTAKQEPVEPIMSRSPPAYEESNVRRSGGGGGGGRRKTEEDGLGPEEEDRRAMRRERNKQAAARCRKRRMDLTSTLQVNFRYCLNSISI